MKIYKLRSSEKSMELNPLETANIDIYDFKGKCLNKKEVLEFEVTKKGRYHDYAYLTHAAPIFSEKAIEALKELILKNTELLDINVVNSELKFKLVNVIKVINAVDYTRSIGKYLPDGSKLYDFDRLVFHHDLVKDQNIFKTPEFFNRVYVSEKFRETVLAAKLKGFEFIEVWDSEFTLEKEQEQQAKYEKMLSDVKNSQALRYSFEEAIQLMKQGKAFAGEDWKLQLHESGALMMMRLQLDSTYKLMNYGYIPPILLGLQWIEVTREGI